MPRLRNVTLKAMALTGTPANRRPIHAIKSAPAKEDTMPKGPAKDLDEALPEPSAEILKAISEVQLSKSAGDADAEAAKEAIGRLMVAQPNLSFEDVAAVAKAVGLEPVAKASDDEDEEDEEDDVQDEDGKFKKGNPFAKKMKKSAPSEDYADVLKSAPAPIAKAIAAMQAGYEAARKEDLERIAKAERIAHEERDYRLTGNIRAEVQDVCKSVGADTDKLTNVVKHLRTTGKGDVAKDLMQVLKAADAQLSLARKSGGSPFGSVGASSQFGAGGGTSAMAKINAHLDGLVRKGEVKKSRPQLMDEFLATDEGMALWAQHNEEKEA